MSLSLIFIAWGLFTHIKLCEDSLLLSRDHIFTQLLLASLIVAFNDNINVNEYVWPSERLVPA